MTADRGIGQYMDNDWEIIKTITEAEHHFNNLCFKIRTLASTWLLATFAGVGFLITKSIEPNLKVENILVLLCWVGSLGILVLWILDLQIYQKLLSAWFDARKPIEERNPGYPQIRQAIKKTQLGGRASNLIKVFYISLVCAPLLFASYVCFYMKLDKILLLGSVALLIVFSLLIYIKSPGDHNN
jgi:hypothetical protein